jgi:uncharacterized Zn finger protein
MTIDLEHFEDAIHLLIAERGKEYVDAGHVRLLEETDEGWTAIIEGQETYEVLLKGHDKIHDWHCTCPFEHGPVCKHVAAALYVAREAVRLNRAAARGDLDHFIDAAEPAVLRQFLKAEIRRNKSVRAALYAEIKDKPA